MAYNTTAKGLSALGRNGDNTLLHVSKDELAGLQSLIGHKLPTNPHTGLQEAFELKKIIALLSIGGLGALTGGAALAAAPEITAAGATALGAGEGALLGGAYSASQGKGFGAGALGGAISGGLGAYGGSNLPGASTDVSTAVPYGEVPPEVPKFAMPTPEVSSAYAPKYGLEQSLSKAMPVNEQVGLTSGINPNASSVLGKDPNTALSPTIGQATKSQLSAMGNKDNMWEWGKMAGMGSLLGYGAQDMVEQNQAMATQMRQEKLAAQANEQQQQQYFKDLGYPLAPLSSLNNLDTQTQFNYYKDIINPKQGYAVGGALTKVLSAEGTPVSLTVPPRYLDEFSKLDIPHEINQAQNTVKEGAGMANGGYINTQPVNPNAFYPQSQIHSAQPYAAATPQRHEIIEGFEDGGMLDGPGDGMSDDIPANIDGEEEIRLADGEFVVPPDLVRMLGFGDPEKGADLLDNLLPLVRQAAHGKKEQIKQNAGKLAAEKMLVRAAKGKA